MKEFAEKFYRGKSWRACRLAYIDKRVQIDGGLCESCHEQPGFIVHHKTKLTAANINDPFIALNHENLEYLCKDCHDYEHYEDIFGRKPPKKAIAFDGDGQPIPPIR